MPTMSIIVKLWTTSPHVSNVADNAETSTTDNVPYAELLQRGQKRFIAHRQVQPDNPEIGLYFTPFRELGSHVSRDRKHVF